MTATWLHSLALRAPAGHFILEHLIAATLIVGVLPVPAWAAALKTVQSGTLTMNAGSGSAQTVNVPISSVDLTRSILIFNVRGDGTDPGDSGIRGQLTSSTNIQFYRPNDSSITAFDVVWYVAEFVSGVRVQRGTSTPGTAIPIASVDLSKSFVLTSASAAPADATFGNDDFNRARLTSSTQLEIVHNAGASKTADWQVIEFTGASVQRGIGQMTGNTTSANIGITSVDLSKSILLTSWRTTINGTGANFLRGRLTGPAQITLDRGANTWATIDYSWEVVEFQDGTEVQGGSTAFAASSTSETASLTTIDLARSVALLSTAGGRWGGSHNYTADDRVGPGFFTTALTSSTQLTLARTLSGINSNANVGWFVVQFNGPPDITLTESGGSTAVTEGGATDTYTIVLKSQPSADVTITVTPDAQTNLGAGAGSPITLTYTSANWSTPQTVTVAAVNDSIDEGPHSSAIAHTVSSADGDYNGWVLANVTTSVTDNDTAGVTLTQSGGSTAVVEGGATDAYTLVLNSQPVAGVTITVTPDAQVNLGAGAGVATARTFTAANWNTPQSVTVTAVNDPDIEGPHTSAITHAAASGDAKYNGLAMGGVTAGITDNDSAGVTIVQSGSATSVTEGGAGDSYTLALTARPASDVVVTVTPDAQLSLGAGAGAAVTRTFTYADWNTPQTISVGAVNDSYVQGPRTVNITHAVASGDVHFNGLAVSPVAVDIAEDDVAAVSFTLAAQSRTELDGAITVVVQSSALSAMDVTVPYTISGTATVDADYSIAPSPVIIPAGSLTASIAITILDDWINDNDETIVVTMGNPVNAVKGAVVVHTVTITDNEPPGVSGTQSDGSTTVTEGGATDAYTLVLQSQPLADVIISLTTDGKASVSPASVTFTGANWNVPQSITVIAADDAVAEGVHASTITHAAASADPDYQGIVIGDVIATITDNDVAGVIVTESGGSTNAVEGGAGDAWTLVLSSEPLADVAITVTPDAGADVGAGAGVAIVRTFTPVNWNVAQTVNVTAVNDWVAEGAHTATITHSVASADAGYNGIAASSVTLQVTDDDVAGVILTETAGSTVVVEGGATDTYTIALRSEPTADVTISITPDSQGSVGAGAGTPINVTFTNLTWNLPQTITVSAANDFVAEGVHATTITHAASSADPLYDGVGVGNIVAQIADDDAAGIAVSESGGSTDLAEGGAADSWTLVLASQPIADVTITITPDGQSNVGAGAGTAGTRVFTPADWNTPQTVTIGAVDDAVAEGLHVSNVTQTVASADPLYNGMPVVSIVAAVADNDSAGVIVTETGGGTAVTEGGAADTYTLVLNSRPTAPVTIMVTPDAAADLGSGAGAAVTRIFTPGNWNTPQPVNVTAVDDAVDEGPHTAGIVHTPGSADPFYDGLAIVGITATIADNDVAGITRTESGGSTQATEGGAGDTYTLVLNTQPIADVTITMTPDTQTDLGAGAGTAVTRTFTPADWNAPKAIAVAAVNDIVAEGPHASTILHAVASTDPKYDGMSLGPVNVAVTDNDTAYISFALAAQSVDETVPSAAIHLTLSTPSSHDVTVPFSVGGTASSPADYTIDASPLTIPAGDTTGTITVTVNDDFIDDDSETVVVTLGDPVNAVKGSLSTHTLNLMDDEPVGFLVTESGGATVVAEGGGSDTYTIVMQSQPLADVVVTFTADAPVTVSPVSMTFTDANWNVPQTVTVSAVDDRVAEGLHAAIITHTVSSADPGYNGILVGSVTATVADNDNAGVTVTETDGSTAAIEAGAGDSYTIVLTSEPVTDVTITATPDSQCDLGAGPGAGVAVTFTPSTWDTPQTIAVLAVNNVVADGSRSVSIAHAAASTDANYNGIGVGAVTVAITDDDAAGIVLAESDGSTHVTEGGATDTYTIRLSSMPGADVAVTLTPGAQLDLGDGAGTPITLVLTPGTWDQPQTITVAAVNDDTAEGPHADTLTHMAASGDPGYDGLTGGMITAQIADDDVAGVNVVESGGNTAVAEGGATDSWDIVLNSRPNFDVAITITPETSLDLGAGPGMPIGLTFTPVEWDAPQNVRVAVVDDAIAVGSRALTVTYSVASGDGAYDGLVVDSLTVQVSDDDTAGVTVTESGPATTLSEAGGTDSYTLVLTSEPMHDVFVTVDPDAQADVGAGAGTPVTLTFTPLDWNVAQGVMVRAVDDDAIEGAHSSTITHTVSSSDLTYDRIAVATVSAAIGDNDFPMHAVNVAVDPSGAGTIRRKPDLPVYREGTPVTFVAVPMDGFEFQRWDGDASGSSELIVLRVDHPLSITAVFKPIPPGCGPARHQVASSGMAADVWLDPAPAEGESAGIRASLTPGNDTTGLPHGIALPLQLKVRLACDAPRHGGKLAVRLTISAQSLASCGLDTTDHVGLYRRHGHAWVLLATAPTTVEAAELNGARTPLAEVVFEVAEPTSSVAAARSAMNEVLYAVASAVAGDTPPPPGPEPEPEPEETEIITHTVTRYGCGAIGPASMLLMMPGLVLVRIGSRRMYRSGDVPRGHRAARLKSRGRADQEEV